MNEPIMKEGQPQPPPTVEGSPVVLSPCGADGCPDRGRQVAWGKVAIHYFLLATLITLGLVVGISVGRALWVQRAIATAVRHVEGGRFEAAVAALQRVEQQAAFHSECLCRLDLVAIWAYARAGDWDRATRLAENLATRDRIDLWRSDVWGTVAALPSPLITWLVRWFNGRQAPDPRSGLVLVEQERRIAEERHSVGRSAAEAAVPSSSPSVSGQPTWSATRSSGGMPKEGRRWGVVIDPEANVYDLSGKWLARVEPGTWVEVVSIENSSTGQVARCSRLNERQLEVDVCIPCRSLALQPGSLATVSPQEKLLRARWARLVAQRESLRRSPDPRNPYATEVQRLETANREFWRKTRELIRRRDEATGEERMKIMDELRSMKGEDERLGRALEQAKARYAAWCAEHPRRLEDESEWQKLQADIDAVERELAQFSRSS